MGKRRWYIVGACGALAAGVGLWLCREGRSPWQHVGPYGCGVLRGMAIHPTRPGRIVIAVDQPHGTPLYFSDDWGQTWTESTMTPWDDEETQGPSEGVAGLALDPSTPNHMIAPAGEGGYWDSSDAGESWTPVRLALTDPSSYDSYPASSQPLAFVPEHPGTVVWLRPVNRGRSVTVVLRTEDGGETWGEVAGLPGSFDAVKVSPGGASRLIATSRWNSRKGPFVSDDAGRHWEALDSGRGSNGDSARVCDMLRYMGAEKEADALAPWLESPEVSPPAVWPDENGGWFATVERDSEAVMLLHFPRDSGAWRAIGEVDIWPRDQVFCQGTPGQPERLFVATARNGLWTSNDRGKTWQPAFHGISELYADSIDERGDRIFVGTSNGVYETDPAASRWTRLGGELGGPFDQGATPREVEAVAALEGAVLAIGRTGLWRFDKTEGVWDRLDSPPSAPTVTPGLIQVPGFAGNSACSLPTACGNTVELVKGRHAVFLMFRVRGASCLTIVPHLVLRSEDEGRTWSPITFSGGFALGLAVDPRHPGRVWAIGDEEFGISADEGRTWGALRPAVESRREAWGPLEFGLDAVEDAIWVRWARLNRPPKPKSRMGGGNESQWKEVVVGQVTCLVLIEGSCEPEPAMSGWYKFRLGDGWGEGPRDGSDLRLRRASDPINPSNLVVASDGEAGWSRDMGLTTEPLGLPSWTYRVRSRSAWFLVRAEELWYASSRGVLRRR